MARPTPVLPDVGSTIVPPGLSLPSRSACSIIASPIRSLTEPPGFRYSSLARIRAWPGGERLSSRTIGVPPTRSRTVGYSRGIAQSLELRDARRAVGLGSGRELLGFDQHDSGHERRDADAHEHPEGQGRPGGEGLREVALPVHLDQVVEAAQEHRRTESYADGSSDLLRGVDEPGSEAGLVVADSCERRDRDRDEGERQPEADQQVTGQERAHE